MAGALTYRQAFTDPFCETASASPRPASPSASAHLSSARVAVPTQTRVPMETGKAPREQRRGGFCCVIFPSAPGLTALTLWACRAVDAWGTSVPMPGSTERVRRPRNQAQVQPSRHTGSRNTFDALVTLRGAVPDRSPRKLRRTRGRSGRPLLAASCTPDLTFTFWPRLMARGIFVS